MISFVTAPPKTSKYAMWSRPSLIVIIVILAIGTALRLYKFPNVPAGLNQDELSAGYESYSLLQTGADRWGFHLPIYFLSWGSGQNVLQSYLSIPAFAIWGLTPFATRIVPLLLGLATLPLFFYVLRKSYGVQAAFVGLAILSVSPWHVVLSRWALESNLLPFFLLLGSFTFIKAIQDKKPVWIVVSLVPFSFALYAYGIAVVIVPPLICFLLLFHYSAVRKQLACWTVAVGLMGLLTLPECLFIAKNYVTKSSYGFERILPFSVPLLPVTRLSQVQGSSPIRHNVSFFLHGLQDHYAWNQVQGIPPLPRLVLVLAIVGVIVEAVRVVREPKYCSPFLAGLLACVPLLFIVPVNINQANALFLPLIALAALGLTYLGMLSSLRAYKQAILLFCLVYLGVTTSRFVGEYFSPEHARATAMTFNPDLPRALRVLHEQRSNGEQIYITDEVLLNYVQVLFYLKVDPKTFQQSGATSAQPDFGRYHFSLSSVEPPFGFLSLENEALPCLSPRDLRVVGRFVVGDCRSD